MRDLPTIIDQMLVAIPSDQENLRAGLSSVKDSSLFAAPEMQVFWWKRGQEVLMEYVPGTNVAPGSWQEKVINIWVGDRGGGVLFNPEQGR